MPRLREHRFDRWSTYWLDRYTTDVPSVIAVDTETTGLAYHDTAFCATVSWRGLDDQLTTAYLELEGHEAGPYTLRRMMLDAALWVFHNAKFDLQKLILAGILTEEEVAKRIIDGGVHDTSIIWTLIDENERRGLKILARRVLGEGTNEEEVLKKVRRKLKIKKDDGYYYIPRQFLIPYARKDTEFTLRLFEIGSEKLSREGMEDVLRLYLEEEMPLTLTLLRMESQGMGVDREYLEEAVSEYGVRVMQSWQRIVYLTGDPELNPNSTQQLQAAFAARGVHLDSTAAAVLEEVEDELAAAILQYREDKKLYQTYLKPLQDESADGVFHPWFNQVQARTGRMSSSKVRE